MWSKASNNYKWDDDDCSDKFRTICQIKGNIYWNNIVDLTVNRISVTFCWMKVLTIGVIMIDGLPDWFHFCGKFIAVYKTIATVLLK